ncbi:ferredoxin [Jatrophihabitans telluris]|uniref:Ferredoxin n=1 Tax=Jatrophihabitans telluris TaxID=2038343 RepID=A0ABY4QZ73_9ACTN|nr:ferredoxin [Jatrophihabitans telluris]UQX88311.1 ferredoxin [Jatrophihabitans telluris]
MRSPSSTPTGLTIDWSRCDGHGLCAALLPDAISLDDWGYPVIDERRLTEQSGGDVRRAVSVCPALALRLSVEG